MITVHRKIAWQLQIAYLEIIRRLIWLLRKANFFGYCSSHNYFPNAHFPIICLLHIEQFFHHFKSSTYLFTAHTEILCQLQIAYLETFQRFIWLLRKAQFFCFSASIILLLRISQLFIYCKTNNYFNTENRLDN